MKNFTGLCMLMCALLMVAGVAQIAELELPTIVWVTMTICFAVFCVVFCYVLVADIKKNASKF